MQRMPPIMTAEQADNLAKLVLSGIELLGEADLFRFTQREQLDHGRNLEDLARALHASRVAWVRDHLVEQRRPNRPGRRHFAGRFHHRLIHRDCGWVIRMGADGRPDFIPPSHIDPRQRALRNRRLHPMRT